MLSADEISTRDWVIYVLEDPRHPGEVRYVGWTVDARTRLRDHCKKSALAKSDRRSKWIGSLIRAGVKPIMVIVERGRGDGWARAETRWIAHYRANGCDLTNHSDGGQGSPGRQHTPEARARMSAKRKGRAPSPQCIAAHCRGKRNPEVGERIAASLADRPKSPEHREKLAAALRGRTLTPEHRAAVSAGMKGKKRQPMSQAQKEALSAARKGKPLEGKRLWWATLSAAERSAIARKGWDTRRAE